MDEEFFIKSTDSAPSLDALLTSGRPDDRDLNGAAVTVVFQATFASGGTFSDIAEVVDPLTRHVRYVWGDPLPLAPGIWAGEWRVVWNDGLTATYPNHTFFYLKVLQALGGS